MNKESTRIDEDFPSLRVNGHDTSPLSSPPSAMTRKRKRPNLGGHEEELVMNHVSENGTDDGDDDEEDQIAIHNIDKQNVYVHDKIINVEPVVVGTKRGRSAVAPSKKTAPKSAISRRRQTIDTGMDLRELVLRNNSTNDMRTKLMQSFNTSKNQIVIDYNMLAFLQNQELEDDVRMETRMKNFIESFQKEYKNIQHIEYKMDNKLYCAIDIVYFLPILFNKATSYEMHKAYRKSLDQILERLDDLAAKISPSLPIHIEVPVTSKPKQSKSKRHSQPLPPPPSPKEEIIVPTPIEEIEAEDTDSSKDKDVKSLDRNVRLYSIGSDFYFMCRKKQNFVDGQKHLKKKYGNCKLLKTWNNRTDVKEIGRIIRDKFPQLTWNARTNILTNSKTKEVSDTELLNYLVKYMK